MTKLYLAGPLFTPAERSFNAELARFLEIKGLGSDLRKSTSPAATRQGQSLRMDVEAINWADKIIDCMAAPSPTATPLGNTLRHGQNNRLLSNGFLSVLR
jgi:nucleoside 2-deoxyribosyltransferase